jgi:hypothetical protein
LERPMTAATTESDAVNPCYCPNCQRIFHQAPADYLCPADRAPLIDAGDELPTKLPMLMQVGLGVVGAAVLCTGLLV